MEWTPHWSPWASSDTVSCTFSYHTWHFIIFTITACIFSYSLSVSFWTQDLALQQILSSIDLFLYYRTDYTDSRTIYDFTLLNGCTGKCVRLSRLLAFEYTLNQCTFIHSFIHFILSLHSFHTCTSSFQRRAEIHYFPIDCAAVTCATFHWHFHALHWQRFAAVTVSMIDTGA